MKKLLLILAGLIVLILFASVIYAKYHQSRKNLLTNGDFEAQWVPERSMVMTNHIAGWRVVGHVGLWREGSNTYVAIAHGSRIEQNYLIIPDWVYAASFRVAAFTGREHKGWVAHRSEVRAGKWRETMAFTADRPGVTVYVDGFNIRATSEGIRAGQNDGWAEYHWREQGGFTGKELESRSPLIRPLGTPQKVDRQLN